MYPTRRYWAIAGLGAFFLLFTLLIDRPLALGGTVAIGVVLLVSQALTVGSFTRAERELTVEYTLSQSRVAINNTIFVTMRASQPATTDVDVTVTAQPPVAAHSVPQAERQLRLPVGETSATKSFELEAPIAGRLEVGEPIIQFTDHQGLFTETFVRGPTATFTVEPRGPNDMHVGQAGEQMLAAYGEHQTNRSGSGLTPAGLRQYVPGDTLNQIDWKATARQATPYVREFEVEADRTTHLIVDHRAAMDIGPAGQTMLDFAREVALGIVQSAQKNNDALSLYCVGDLGLTTTVLPRTTAARFRQIRGILHELTPTAPETSVPNTQSSTAHPSVTRIAAQRLTTDQSAFAARIRPFLTASDVYVEHIQDDPLLEAVRRAQLQESGSSWTILLTDDTDRDRVRETARTAAKYSDNVLVFLTPTVLFKTDTLADLDTAYRQYVDFEKFRRSLHSLSCVAAFEVGPGDHLETILTHQRMRPQQESEQ
ncbi:Uncharacterized conserved protein, DUF58 family, contains vWF domain [Halogranum amylolyticum]|uniref:Uncharacterized conserved protein, DUF58 family, contains vWF domain n=2 Tax=Halogranum amylolyticum TaxID=660520 RepID=A0A1H8WQ91_9EURY|nr:Uncharacterized conserved protein, DUF58 family, contains vWF domain [Halogranum amylolyticum]